MPVEILLTPIVGFLIGAVARYAMPGDEPMSWLATTLLGIGGSLAGAVGGLVLGPHTVGEPIGWVGAILGAVLLLVIYRTFKRPS
jgi:uncharacterized membrane protein YeaQ/YmgE (transglycosylase-associated protein family)